MPLSRYHIRNEYSLADHELYKAADKDDPEALLEGVAMAGLVGVLRQLGDLAEFAAKVFQDMHEEVMATAARGHNLIVRVQQLEAEFPSIERTLLRQTSHTSFIYNSGVDWHPNLCMDKNLITRRDLPRFIMDSYEECCGPPRLFLLDKFDVAGAGTCLKRYTDPSFFKTESKSSNSTKSDAKREKKIRRVKKRAPRWQNGETPESFSSSHAKLHELFLEERLWNDDNDPERRVKLKRRQLTGYFLDQDNKKSYMEKFVDMSPRELKMTTSIDNCDSGLEIVEIGTVKESIKTVKSLCSSPDTGEHEMKLLVHDLSERKLTEVIDRGAVEVPQLNQGSDACKILRLVKGEECIDMESDSQVSIDDGFASDIDNYADALATIESEVETDLECKRTTHYLNAKPIIAEFYGGEGQKVSGSLSSDSPSFGNCTTSEDGNIFFRDRENSSCSMSVNSMAESTKDLEAAVVGVPSLPAPKSDPGNKTEVHAMTSNGFVEADDFTESKQNFEETSNTSHRTGPNTIVLPMNMKANLGESSFPSPELEEEYSDLADSGIVDNQGAPKRTDIGHWSSGEHPLDDEAGRISFVRAGTSHDLSKTPDDPVPVVEEHINELGIADLDVCSDVRQPHAHPLVPAAKHQETMNPIDTNADLFLSWTRENSEDQYSAPDHTQNLNIQQEFHEMKNWDHGSLLDSASVALPSSEDCSTKEILPDVEAEGKTSAPIVGLTEPSPLIFNGQQACASESSFSEITEAEETAECHHLEAATLGAITSGDEATNGKVVYGFSDDEMVNRTSRTGKPSLVSYLRETNNQSQKLAEAAPLEHHQAEAGDQRPWKSSNIDGDSFSVGGKEEEAPLYDGILEGASISQKFALVHQGNSEPDEAEAYLDDGQTQAIQIDSTSRHDFHNRHADKSKDFSHETYLSDMPSKITITPNFVSAAENNSTLDHDMAEREHIEFFSNDCGQVDTENVLHDKIMPLSSSEFLNSEKLEDPPVSLIEECLQCGEELIPGHNADLSIRKDLDAAQDAPVDSNSNMSPNVSPSLILLDDSSAQVVENDAMLIHSVEPPFTSEIGRQEMKLTLPYQIHPVISKLENPGQLVPPSYPVAMSLPAESPIGLEPPPLPPMPPMQWRLGRFQNSSKAIERKMVQHTPVPVLQTTNVETEVGAISPDTRARRGCSDDYAAEQEVTALPKLLVPDVVSDVSSQNNMIEIKEESHSITAAQTSISSQYGNKALEEFCQPSMNLAEYGSIVEAHASGNDIVMEENCFSTEVGFENGQPEHISQVSEKEAMNSHGELPLSSTAHNHWHSQQGFEAPETGSILSSAHDGNLINAEETLQNRLPRPRNPLIDEVVAIDKSKLRKVERVKPPSESKGDEGESLLEQLQLRKVGERTKLQVESKIEEIGPLLEQLQLRKVGERVKPETNLKAKETESPRVQLKKVIGRAHSMVGPKTEDRDSLLEQIKNKSFNLRPAAMSRPNIQGPSTNLRVTAILQKASNIRQAMAGSDEEDDADNWSDC